MSWPFRRWSRSCIAIRLRCPLLTATLIWAGVVLLTIGMLVPINNRIASLNIAAPAPGWKRDHTKWDSLHRIRILLLAVALFVLTDALTV